MPVRPSATIIAALAIAILPTVASAQAAPRFVPSGRGTSEITVAMPEGTPDSVTPPKIRVDHGQPHLRGRTLHTDSLVPFDKVWRTGANATTTLTTDLALMIGGVKLPAGRYALLTIPSAGTWKLIIQKDAGEMAGAYDAAADLARVDLVRRELATPVESLSMWLIPSTKPGVLGGELRLVWGNTELSTPFTAVR
ncbi:MAG: DUF2911 domain-containing protein [Gemmatimonadales bacterium]|nr:DUF2911 domain-containing protein [Gemmatimonadales bacterium]